ncbi:5-oxoprolinase subunit B family protein [Jongsikchunia kroppenstedtii]|uniref:5-oxoprolinase subunit B family protein n=1 Tax=Jongsikchunia kroppenstedtii TaxID=1121721 RepID=UPI000371795B|nr:allophanate hydrolase subunit 1 [Jongsikchunia kroppenstedtii]
MRDLPAGRDAVLLDCADEPDPGAAVLRTYRALRNALAAGTLDGVIDVVPSAQTILLQAEPGRGIDALGLRRVLKTIPLAADTGAADAWGRRDRASDPQPTVRIPVHYDGDDLAAIADATNMNETSVILAHVETLWRVEFMGFAPGFGYLVPQPRSDGVQLAAVPRRSSPRTRVPTGAVAVAGGYSAVYPRESPGGWNILGHTDTPLWDAAADPPAVLAPGDIVQFQVAT